MEVIEDQLDSNRPIQGVKVVSNGASLPAPRAAAPRDAFDRREGPREVRRSLTRAVAKSALNTSKKKFSEFCGNARVADSRADKTFPGHSFH